MRNKVTFNGAVSKIILEVYCWYSNIPFPAAVWFSDLFEKANNVHCHDAVSSCMHNSESIAVLPFSPVVLIGDASFM